jgi:hypothetical protein
MAGRKETKMDLDFTLALLKTMAVPILIFTLPLIVYAFVEEEIVARLRGGKK